MKKWSFVALLIAGATILGATVLREPIATAASPFTNVIVGNTADNPVPVKQQGTVHSEIVGPLDDQGNVMVDQAGARWTKVAENLTVVNGTPFTYQTPWVNVSDCGQILFFTRSSFAIFPLLEFSADKSFVDFAEEFDDWTRPTVSGTTANGWATYPPAHLAIRFTWARFNFPLSKFWADSTMTTVWMVCQPK